MLVARLPLTFDHASWSAAALDSVLVAPSWVRVCIVETGCEGGCDLQQDMK